MIGVAVVILVGVFFVATGRGGELAYEHADHAPLDLGPVSATDVVLLRPPTALWGYNMQVTDEALERIAQAVRDRDVTIAAGDGVVTTEQGEVGRIRLVRFASEQAMRLAGSGQYSTDQTPLPATDAKVTQGALERLRSGPRVCGTTQ